jgi:HEAT repeat protein
MYDAFISYARIDGNSFAERIEFELSTAGYTTWRDKRNIDEYQDFSVEIELAIQNSRFILVCVTPSMDAKSNFVRREIIYAQNKEKPIIPLVVPNTTLPTLINHLTWIPFYSNTSPQSLNYDEGITELKSRLAGNPQQQKSILKLGTYSNYLRDLYDSIVNYYLQRTVFSMIDLYSRATEKAVKSSLATHPRALSTVFFDMAGINAPTEQVIFENFDQAFQKYEGRVLLLGQPGAGKTTTLMAFARDAVVQRLHDSQSPLPIVAPITTWDPENRISLNRWLTDLVPIFDTESITNLLSAGKLLLLMDGLDELGGLRLDNETKQLYDPRQRFLQIVPKNNGVVITCRVNDYNEIGQRASLHGAVTLQPLHDNQIRDYLKTLPTLWKILQADLNLRKMAQTPLLLKLFTDAFAGLGEAAKGLSSLTSEELRDKIFETYVQQRFTHEARKPHANMPFNLEQIYEFLGAMALRSTIPYIKTEDIKDIFKDYDVDIFLELTTRLHILVTTSYDSLGFIHLLLRDYFAFRYIRKHVKDKDDEVRRIAVNGLSRFGGSHALDLLVAALDDRVSYIRRSAAQGLAKLSDKRAVYPLITVLKDENATVRSSAAQALRNFNDQQALIPLIAALKDQDSEVRYHSVYALRGLNNQESIEPLISVLNDKDQRVRQAAVQVLGFLRDKRALEPLIGLLDNTDDNILSDVIEALGNLGNKDAVEPLVLFLNFNLPDRGRRIRTHAAEALGKLGDIRAVEPLMEDLSIYDTSRGVAIAKLDELRIIEWVLTHLENEDILLRREAVSMLRAIGTPLALMLVEEALRVSDVIDERYDGRT